MKKGENVRGCGFSQRLGDRDHLIKLLWEGLWAVVVVVMEMFSVSWQLCIYDCLERFMLTSRAQIYVEFLRCRCVPLSLAFPWLFFSFFSSFFCGFFSGFFSGGVQARCKQCANCVNKLYAPR